MVVGPYWFFGFDSIMESIAFVIAIAVAYQAMKGYRFSKERNLLYLNLSFVLLGTGLLIEGLANAVVLLSRFHRGVLFLSGVGYTIDFIAQFLAYGILVVTYVQQARSVGMAVALAALPLLAFERNAFTEFILLFLLAYISTQTAINYGVSRTTNALLVFGAFASLAIAHLFFLLFALSERAVLFPFAHIAQLFGFLLLLAMLLRVNQPS